MAGGKTVTLTTWTFAGKGLLFYMLSRFVIAFLPRNKYFISWLRSPLTVILEPKKIKSVSASTFPLLFAMKWWDQMSWSQFFFFFLSWVSSQLNLSWDWDTSSVSLSNKYKQQWDTISPPSDVQQFVSGFPKHWYVCEKVKTLVHSWWECKV